MKFLKWGVPALIALAVGGYIGFWLYAANIIRNEIDHAYENAQNDGYEYLGPKPTLGNFPFVPEITYTNGVHAGNIALQFPEMKLRGYPVSFATLTIDFPNGLSLQGPVMDPALWSLEGLTISAIIPARLPADFTQESLGQWQQSGGKIDVTDFRISKQTLKAQGKGLLSLDDTLQPQLNFETTAEGYQEFIVEQRNAGYIQPFPAAAAAAVMNSLSTIDPATGRNRVSVNVVVKDRMLSVGPIQALPLPEIVWGTRSQPVLPQ